MWYTQGEVIAVINETSIRCFLTLCSTLNFTEAAKRMYMTQQSVSKYIAKLEEDIGFALFVRTHHYVTLTRAGEEFRALFSRLDRDYNDTVQRMRQYYDELNNSLRIGYLEWLDLMPTLNGPLHRLREANPALRFAAEKHPQYELNQHFLNRRLDLIITYREFAPKAQGLKKLALLQTPLVLLVSPDNPKATAQAKAADFSTEPFIKAASSQETLSESRARARRQVREIGFSPRGIIIAPNLESAYVATELGQGVLVSTMLSRMSMNSELRSYPLGMSEELQCFWHEDDENPAIAAFVAELKG